MKISFDIPPGMPLGEVAIAAHHCGCRLAYSAVSRELVGIPISPEQHGNGCYAKLPHRRRQYLNGGQLATDPTPPGAV